MPYDLNDPNLDFADQAEILARALKRSQLDRDTEAHGNQGVAGGIGAALSRAAGQYSQSQAEASQTALNREQLKRYDELTRQMNQPGTKTVLTKSLRQGEGPLMEPNFDTTETQRPLDYSNPDDLIADNTRRMGIATQMSKLPLAQKTAQDYLSRGAAFPEAIAKMRMDQIERGQQAAQKAQDTAKENQDKREWQAQQNEMYKRTAEQQNAYLAAALTQRGGGGKSSDPAINQDAADFIAGRFLEGDKTALTGISRNKDLHAAVMGSIARQAKEQGIDPKESVQRGLEYTGATSEQRTMGTQAANVAMAANEANKMIDIATGLSKKVPRTEFPTLNTAGNVIQKQSGDPNIVAFDQSIDSLINGYARAINPRGVATVADKKRAHEKLSSAFTNGQFDATVAVMRQEMEAALAAPASARATARETRVGSSLPKATAAPLTVTRTGTRNGVKVQEMSDGSIQEVK